MIRSLAAALSLLAMSASAAGAAEILIHDDKSQPESLSASAATGDLYVGSASSPYIYRVKKGATTAEQFVDGSAFGTGTIYLGQLVDDAGGKLWSCILKPAPGGTGRASALVAYDLKTAKEVFRWDLPETPSTCNDIAIGPDKAAYVSDTANAKIYRLAPGAKTAEVWLAHRSLTGIDGLTFSGGALYLNSVYFNTMYRVPVGADGKAGTPEQLWIDMPARGLDGLRSQGGTLYQAASGHGRIDALTVTGERAHVVVIKDGLKGPTAVEPAGDVVWIAERGAGKVWSVPTPK
ncbi:MAG: hypothetical protein BGN86_05450 [Caulobacterales bacterium 68-7]|nr:MAG: hypothetical protein BGN86_05450 [Caulobacterales bacterium 68-7]